MIVYLAIFILYFTNSLWILTYYNYKKGFDMTGSWQLSMATTQGETFLNMTTAREGGTSCLLNHLQLSYFELINFQSQKRTGSNKRLLESFARPVEFFFFSFWIPVYNKWFFCFWNLKILCFIFYRKKKTISDSVSCWYGSL